jgi:hypothetical protein
MTAEGEPTEVRGKRKKKLRKVGICCDGDQRSYEDCKAKK